MKLLAIETSTDACSAALHWEGEIAERFEIAPRQHAAKILDMVESLLSESQAGMAQLDAIAFGRGPGAFTGLRIASAVAQGLALGSDRPVIPVSSLAALAAGCHREQGGERLLAALDARMGEVYWGVYSTAADGSMTLEGEERVCPPDAIPRVPAGDACAVGSGWQAHREALLATLPEAPAAIFPGMLPQAQDVAQQAVLIHAREGGLPAEQALPVYLRDNVASKPR